MRPKATCQAVMADHTYPTGSHFPTARTNVVAEQAGRAA